MRRDAHTLPGGPLSRAGFGRLWAPAGAAANGAETNETRPMKRAQRRLLKTRKDRRFGLAFIESLIARRHALVCGSLNIVDL